MNKAIHLLMLTVLLVASASSVAAKEFKVFILAGQSNMVGYGSVENGRVAGDEDKKSKKRVKGGVGSLRHYVIKNKEQYGSQGKTPLIDKAGDWIKRDDVFIYTGTEFGDQKGKLSVGFGGGKAIGPEFAFGHVVGNAFDCPVLIIKAAWGGKNLAVNFRPPRSGPYPKKVGDPKVGRHYRLILEVVKKVLDNYETHFPELKGLKPKIAGFGWHQGWNDGSKASFVAEYETNMVNFIKDMRKDLNAPNMPFVIANSGMIGPEGNVKRRRDLCKVQMAVGDPKKHPEFKGNVTSVDTCSFKRASTKSPATQGYHWNRNGECYFLVGKSIGDAMIKMMQKNR